MTLSDFYSIMIEIVGVPTNDYEQFIIYTLSCILGMFIILFVFQLFMMVANLAKIRQK